MVQSSKSNFNGGNNFENWNIQRKIWQRNYRTNSFYSKWWDQNWIIASGTARFAWYSTLLSVIGWRILGCFIRWQSNWNNRTHVKGEKLWCFEKLWRRRFAHKKVWLSLYNEFLKYANSKSIEHIILDTPAVAHISHRFYEKAGFKRINSEELPV